MKIKQISLIDILPIRTSHGCGQKRILLRKEETNTTLTQIAITALSAGEESGAHIHPTMEECFLVRKGEIRIELEEKCISGSADDFIHIPAGTMHNVIALTNVELLTIGCATIK